jgi:hypothetical protein
LIKLEGLAEVFTQERKSEFYESFGLADLNLPRQTGFLVLNHLFSPLCVGDRSVSELF